MAKYKNDEFDFTYVVRLQNGDSLAFDYIFNFYKNQVYWMGLHFFSNEELAKDLVQSVFLEVYKNIEQLKEPSRFRVWLNKITYNRCLQMVRYNMKDTLHYTNDLGDEYCEEHVVDNKKDDALTTVQKQQAKEIIIHEIEKLTPEYRTICYLRLFEELSWPEISEVTKIPVGTVSSFMARMRPKLKKALEKKGFTSSSCLGLITIPNLTQYFKAFVNSKKPLSDADILSIKNHVQNKSKSRFNNKLKWLTYCLIVISLGLPLAAIGILKNENNLLDVFTQNDVAKIKSINYLKQPTNKSLNLDVNTTNNNYDDILINGIHTNKIDANGKYEISLIDNGKEIDSQKIEVKNIDLDIPYAVSKIINKDTIIFTITDTDSGVNFNQITFYKGNQKLESQLFKVNNQVQINVKDNAIYHLVVPDNVGNILNITINVKEGVK